MAHDLAFGRQVESRRQPEYEHGENPPVYDHERPHPKLSGTAETPEQGYVGKNVIHTNFETATGDWSSEYGPSPKPKPSPVYIPPAPPPHSGAHSARTFATSAAAIAAVAF